MGRQVGGSIVGDGKWRVDGRVVDGWVVSWVGRERDEDWVGR